METKYCKNTYVWGNFGHKNKSGEEEKPESRIFFEILLNSLKLLMLQQLALSKTFREVTKHTLFTATL